MGRVRGLAVALLSAIVATASAFAQDSPHHIYDSLNALRPDPATVYELKPQNRIELRRSDLKLSLEDGRLAFFAPFDGLVTGAVFAGRGHVLAAPRDSVEKQQMGRFLGAPVLDQEFQSAYLRFTDDTAADLLNQLKGAGVSAESDAGFASSWDSFAATNNPSHSLRILFHHLAANPRPYFYAAISGASVGPFDFLFDSERVEPFLLSQLRKNGNRAFFDVWASYAPPGFSPPPTAFRAVQYAIETTILPDISLQASATVRLRAEAPGVRHLVFQLSRSLATDSVEDQSGHALPFFQNEGMTAQERTTRGNDTVYVILPAGIPSGSEFTLRFRYHGNVIENSGNGVLYVGAHESWYPHLGEAASFAEYDLIMRWPRKLRLVATGSRVDEHEEGEQRVGHWQTEKPVSVVGFNLGEYASTSLSAASYGIEVFANRFLEQSVSNRLENSSDFSPALPGFPNMPGKLSVPGPSIPPPSPTERMKQLGKEIESSIRFYETFSGPFPFHTLSVSQIPGTVAQSWPGLLYLPTFSYLPPEAQHRAGLSSSAQEHFSDLAPFHEVAHQWWGNLVGWSSYRDQWICESISNYLAVLFANTQKNPEHTIRVWMERFRHKLVTKSVDADDLPADAGALVLGNRLDSSHSPEAYEQLIYSKGAWVIHMLREMLRQPASKTPDARFEALLRHLVWKYSYRPLSTVDLQHEVEAVMTPAMDLEGGRSMDWFFEQWVRGTGIPHYRVEFNSTHNEKGIVIRGKLFQSGVPRSFIAPVPLYYHDGGRPVYLGTVVASGPETSFHFTAAAAPRKLLIDPQLTLLCTTQ
jgi:hypothetical protein